MLRFSFRSIAQACASMSAGHQCRGGSFSTPPAISTTSTATSAVRSKTSRCHRRVEDRQQCDARYGADREATGDEPDRGGPPIREPPGRVVMQAAYTRPAPVPPSSA